MVVGEIRNKVDRIWEIFWTGGITNPLSVIEQITYLLFIKGLDDAEDRRSKECALLGLEFKPIFPPDRPELHWGTFKNLDAVRMYDTVMNKVFPFIKGLHNGRETAYATYMEDAIFIVPTPQLLQRIVTALDDLPMEDRDGKGDIYEYMLGKLNTSGQNGQFRTPRHIIRMMVDMLQPQPDDVVCDPAMAQPASSWRSANTYGTMCTICSSARTSWSTTTAGCSPATTWTGRCCASAR